MEDNKGSVLEQVIGVGTKTDPDTNRTIPITETYPSYFKNMVRAFESLPIAKQFGLTIRQAMELPVDEWYRIRDSARELAAHQPETTETQLLQLIKELVASRNTEGE